MMDKLDMFQYRFGRINVFGWRYLERIPADSGPQFTSTEFQDKCKTRGVHLMSAALEHQEMNRQVEVTWRMLRTITHSLMVHVRVSVAYIHFILIYTEDHIFLILTIKDLINEDGKLTI